MTEWDRAYMNARRYPRTMTEAFGPYTSSDLQPMPQPPMPAHEKALYIVSAIALMVVIVASFFY